MIAAVMCWCDCTAAAAAAASLIVISGQAHDETGSRDNEDDQLVLP